MNQYKHFIGNKLLKMKDGTGEVTVFFETDKLLFAAFLLEPGCSLNKDIHPNGEEGYYVIEGELTVTLPELDSITHVNEGEAFFIGAGILHIASNMSEKTTRVVAAIAPKCK